MKALVQRMYAKPSYAKALEWGKLIAITGSGQIVAYVLSFISGIIVIRLLSTKEYAIYTLANTMLGTMVILADGGIAAGVMSQGGKVWKDREKLGQVIVTGIDLRKKFAIVSLLFAVPVLFYLLIQHGVSLLSCLLILMALVPAFLTALSADLLQIVPKLNQNLKPLQQVQVIVSIGRLMFIGLSLFIFPFSYIAILAAGLPQMWANFRLKILSYKYIDKEQIINTDVRREIISIVRRILPGAIYFCLSSQITIWLISFFGSTEAIAQVGALGRFGVILTLFGMVSNFFIEPRFSRLDYKRRILLKRYLQINCALLLLSVFIILFICMFSDKVLWILGPNYSGLNNQLILIMVGSCLSFIASVIFYLSTSRGWAINPVISIPTNIIAIFCSAMIINVSTLNGILLLNICVAVTNIILYETYLFYKILKGH